MEKLSKTTKKSLVIAFVAICIFSFIPAAYGHRNHGVTIRPIEDWLVNNPFVVGMQWDSELVGSDRAGNNYWMFPDSIDGAFTGTLHDYNGHVKEKVLSDGSIEITVHIKVEDVYLEGYYALLDENGDPIWNMNYWGDLGDIVFAGYIDYIFMFKFTLDPEYDGFAPWGIPPGTREAGCNLPFIEAIFLIPEAIGVHVNSYMFIGYGEGNLFEPGWRWPAPDEPFTDEPILTDEVVKVFLLEYAKFDNDDYLTWPTGSSGFKKNIICLY